AHALVARHRGDRLAPAATRDDEHGCAQRARAEARLAHQRPTCRSGPQPPRPVRWLDGYVAYGVQTTRSLKHRNSPQSAGGTRVPPPDPFAGGTRVPPPDPLPAGIVWETVDTNTSARQSPDYPQRPA